MLGWSVVGERSSIREREHPVLGFCFSFPVEQTAVDAGRLLAWTKGYENPGAVGADPAKLLADAFRRKVVTASPSQCSEGRPWSVCCAACPASSSGRLQVCSHSTQPSLQLMNDFELSAEALARRR
jgi:hypothetical protein